MKGTGIKCTWTKLNIIVLCLIMGSKILNGWASECSNPEPEWLFYSCWETATGIDHTALRDGTKWSDARYRGMISIVNDLPSGAGRPETTNAFRVAWTASGSSCKDSTNSFIEKFFDTQNVGSRPTLTNPWYARVYFYADGSPSGRCNRKFMQFRCSSGFGSATGLYFYNDASGNPRLLIKNGAYSDGYDCATCNHLTSIHAWPGKSSNGIITPNAWHAIEFAWYRHPTNGWLKAWLDGKLAINAVPAAFGGSFNTVNTFRAKPGRLTVLWNENTTGSRKAYRVQIDGNGSPNTFRWADNGKGSPWTATGIPLTGNYQSIGSEGVQVKFSGRRGGVVGDYWVYGCDGMIDWLQMPSYVNGGMFVTHKEYLANFIVSSTYIGP